MFKQLLLLTAAVLPVWAQMKQPEPTPLPPPIPAPHDEAYLGPIQLAVDATDVTRRIVKIHETVPVRGGELILLYPEWIPGDHSPTGPIQDFGGLVVKANGQIIPWMRDRVDVYAFHIKLPQGVHSVDVDFQYLSPIRSSEGRVCMSGKLLDIEWSSTVLYPAGYFSRRIEFDAEITLPPDWKFATALETESQDGAHVRFKRTALNTLVDSPLYAGINFNRIDLSTGPDNIVFLDLFGDTPESVVMKPEIVQLHKNLTLQAQKLYASHHYNHYDFLYSLSNTIGGIGVEHHQSSEDGSRADYLTKWDNFVPERDLLAHEYTHSWDGKFRRPADLWTPNFNIPMRDDLLWVYEGMTEYFGFVLTSRSGLRTAEQTRDLIARVAAYFEASPGRDWRPMEDTTNQPVISQRRPVPWVSWLRQEDYYMEGMLIWLDADTKIRELSGGKKSLDDFAKTFYGIENGSFITHTYKYEDVVAALNSVQPFDWDNFLKTHIYELHPAVPEEGITRGGYKLVYTDTPPSWEHRQEGEHEPGDNYSAGIGFGVGSDGTIQNVMWDSPAFKAGITADMKLTAINGTAFTSDALKTALTKAEKDTAPLQLLIKRGDDFLTISVDYHGGLRYPKLERVNGTPALLDDILAAVP